MTSIRPNFGQIDTKNYSSINGTHTFTGSYRTDTDSYNYKMLYSPKEDDSEVTVNIERKHLRLFSLLYVKKEKNGRISVQEVTAMSGTHEILDEQLAGELKRDFNEIRALNLKA